MFSQQSVSKVSQPISPFVSQVVVSWLVSRPCVRNKPSDALFIRGLRRNGPEVKTLEDHNSVLGVPMRLTFFNISLCLFYPFFLSLLFIHGFKIAQVPQRRLPQREKKSIDLLQLSRYELIQKIDREIEINPFVEKEISEDFDF